MLLLQPVKSKLLNVALLYAAAAVARFYIFLFFV